MAGAVQLGELLVGVATRACHPLPALHPSVAVTEGRRQPAGLGVAPGAVRKAAVVAPVAAGAGHSRRADAVHVAAGAGKRPVLARKLERVREAGRERRHGVTLEARPVVRMRPMVAAVAVHPRGVDAVRVAPLAGERRVPAGEGERVRDVRCERRHGVAVQAPPVVGVGPVMTVVATEAGRAKAVGVALLAGE